MHVRFNQKIKINKESKRWSLDQGLPRIGPPGLVCNLNGGHSCLSLCLISRTCRSHHLQPCKGVILGYPSSAAPGKDRGGPAVGGLDSGVAQCLVAQGTDGGIVPRVVAVVVSTGLSWIWWPE